MFLITINKSVPEMSIPLLTAGAAAPFAPIGLPPMVLLIPQTPICIY